MTSAQLSTPGLNDPCRVEPTGFADDALKAYNKAVALHCAGKAAESIPFYRRALELDPQITAAWHNWGSAMEDLEQIGQAVACYRRALENDPADYRSLYNLFRCYHQLGEYEKAIRIFRLALPQGLDDWKLWNNLGVLLRDADELEQAEVCLRQALAINPDEPTILYNLGIVTQKSGAYEQGLEFYRRALSADPDYAPARWLHDLSLPMIYRHEQDMESSRRRFAANLQKLAAEIDLDSPSGRLQALKGLEVTTNFFLQYQGRNDRQLMSIWGDLVSRIMAANFPNFSGSREMPSLKAGEKIRLGFVSSCLYSHTVGIFLHGWLRHLDKNRFRIFLYHLGRKTDQLTSRTAELAHRFRHLPEGCPKALNAIAGDNLHLLVHTDIGMNPVTTMVAGLRLAPVQCKGWGHPVTTGLPSIDYYLSSDLMEPDDAHEHYTEELVRLPNLALAWQPSETGRPEADRRRFGIGEDAFVFLSTQSLYKYLPRHDDIYPRIAGMVPGSLFVFIEAPVRKVTAVFRERLQEAFRRYGLQMENYCRFVSRMTHPDFMRLNMSADVLLDTLEWSGGKTTLEALACGLPVVTLPGPLMRGRHAYAFLTMMGLEETIARDKDQYCRIAVRLASDKDFLEKVRRKTAANYGRLCDDRIFVRRLEDFLEKAVCQNLNGRRAKAPQTANKTAAAPFFSKPESLLAKAVELQQKGKQREAIPFYRQYLSRCSGDHRAWYNLAVACHKVQMFQQARHAYHQALDLAPDWPEAWFNLAVTLEALGDNHGAVSAYGRAVRINPDYWAAHYNLGLLWEQIGRPKEAAAALEKAVKADPDQPRAWLRLADVLARLKKLKPAQEAYKKAICLEGDLWEAYNNLGNLYLIQDDIDKAIKCYKKVVKACPDLAQAHYNLGSSLRRAELFPEAEACLKRALELAPEYAEAWNNLGLTYKNQGLFSRARKCFDRALEADPTLAAARWNRSFVLLLSGEFKRGWQDFKWRFRIDRWKSIYPFRLDLPAWDGRRIDGTLFVHDEQGLGDTIQFVRYLELARKRCRTLVLETRPELAGLLDGVAGVDRIVLRPQGPSHPPVEADASVALMSLPQLFETDLDTIPARIPYLHPRSDRIAKWRQRLKPDRPTVALVWAGRPQHTNDQNRSLALEMLAPWLKLGLNFVGLQKGPAAQQAKRLPPGTRFINLGPELEDFSDTAAILALCDLVITVDTASAHLAGALGRPVWTLIPFVPDWRWMLERNDSPWYPTMRLYRQQRLKDWTAVIGKVLADLQKQFG